MSRVFCLLERAASGTALTGLRLCDGREVRSLSLAEDSPSGGGVASATEAGLARAAQWIAQQLGPHGPQGVLTLCLDADGGRCQWLSAPSPQVRVVEASVRELAFAGSDDGGERFGVWAASHGEAGMDLSVQPLTETAGAAATAPRGKGASAIETQGERQRLAVLAVPDLPARLLIDELDRLGVVVHECISVWHALAGAWDPARAKALAAGTLVQDDQAGGGGAGGTLVGAGPVSACVAVEARGRLLWTWSRDGVLLAGGAMRLRAVRQGEASVVEVSRSEVGRIVSEWLAWSVQLGVAPSRVGVVGPDTVTCAGLENDLPEMLGVAAVARALGAHWPGAVVSAHVEPDPVGAALARLAGAVVPTGPADAGAAEPSGLAGLSARPVRATRRMYAWSAAAVSAVAVLLGALAWKIDSARARLEAIKEEQGVVRRTALAKVKSLVPSADTAREPINLIRAKIAEMERTRAAMTPERPLLAAFAQIAAGVDAAPGAKFREKERLSITGVGGITARFSVPDAQTGANLLIALRENIGPPRIDWQGTPGGTAENRTYNISGSWVDPKPPARAGAAGGGP